jgi:hypothetical protein
MCRNAVVAFSARKISSPERPKVQNPRLSTTCPSGGPQQDNIITTTTYLRKKKKSKTVAKMHPRQPHQPEAIDSPPFDPISPKYFSLFSRL